MPYSVIPFDVDRHRHALVQLWAANTYDPRLNPGAMERFAWLYEGPQQASHTWVAIETEQGAVVGACSVFRADRRVKGQLLKAGIMNLFMIDARHRTGAAALAMQRALTSGCHAAGFDLVLIKLTEHRVPVFLRTGYRRIGVVRKWIKWLSGDDAPQSEHCSIAGKHEEVLAADARFTRLLRAAMGRGQVLGETGAEFLNWRYSGFRDNFRFHCLFNEEDGELLGSIVFHDMDEGAVVADLLCAQTDGPVVDELLRGFSEAMRSGGRAWISLSFLGTTSFEDTLRRAGFEVTKSRKDRPLLGYASAGIGPEVRDTLFDPSGWFFVGDQTSLLLAESVWRTDQSTGPALHVTSVDASAP